MIWTYCCLRKIEGSCELFASRYSITALQSAYQTRRSYVDPQYVRPEDSNDAHGAFTEEQQYYRQEILESMEPKLNHGCDPLYATNAFEAFFLSFHLIKERKER